MAEWLSENLWAIWLIAAALLAVAESFSLDFTLLMIAAGALVAAGVAVFFPALILLQVIVAVLVAFALLFLLRPMLLDKVSNSPGYRSSLQRMVGSTGRALTAIDGDSGEVKVEGEVWHARSFSNEAIEAGTPVEIFEVDGTTVVVYPKEP